MSLFQRVAQLDVLGSKVLQVGLTLLLKSH